ncbi:MAG TPA: hypothetical protein K8V11_00600 [Dietzia timorensis]|uniref:Mce-associated membrane protein n=1 Tax=Dietzia timorensis TaxID=499555 RepID=A0A921JWU6_9ACTN|nr:hypothetical protein [Dietzia timorensis]HJE89494.1 hypothetical protein [Dietzia timorensis]
MSKDDKTPPENSAESKDPTDPKGTGTGTSAEKATSKDESSKSENPKTTDSQSETANVEASKNETAKAGKSQKSKLEDSDDDATADGEEARKKRGAPRWFAVLSVVILVIGVAGAVWQGIGYFQDRGDKQAASLRDEVIDVASQVVVNSLSFSADTIDEDQERLRADSTGEFLKQQDEYAEQIKQTVTEQGATTSAQISNAALADINEETGTATVLLVYTAQSEREELPPVSGRQAAKVELIREGDDWKVAELVAIGAQVPVGESSESVQQLDDVTGAGEGAAGSGEGSGSASGDKGSADSTADAESGAGKDGRSGKGDSDADASPTSGAAATTAGGN